MNSGILQWFDDAYKNVLARMPSDPDVQKYAPVVAAILVVAETIKSKKP
jgi:hypothetical protein